MWANAQREGRRDRISWIPYGTRNSCLGYVLWHNGLLRNISEDKMIGKPARGRKTMSITCDLAEKKLCGTQKRSRRQERVTEKKWRVLVVIHFLLSRLPERKRATCHIVHHESAWHQSQNWNYITYCVVVIKDQSTATSNTREILWSLDVRFLRYARRQTGSQTCLLLYFAPLPGAK